MLLGCRDDKAESKYDDAYTGFMHIYLHVYLYLATTTHIERPAKSHLENRNLSILISILNHWNLTIFILDLKCICLNKPIEAFIHGNFLPEVHPNTVTVAAAIHYSSQTLNT